MPFEICSKQAGWVTVVTLSVASVHVSARRGWFSAFHLEFPPAHSNFGKESWARKTRRAGFASRLASDSTRACSGFTVTKSCWGYSVFKSECGDAVGCASP